MHIWNPTSKSKRLHDITPDNFNFNIEGIKKSYNTLKVFFLFILDYCLMMR